MTGIYANSIKDKTGTRQLASDSGSAWSWGANVPKGSVIEQFMSPCDGSSITVQSGTYTVQNVTGVQNLDSPDYADLTGSSISYKPPTGTQTVVYSLKVFHDFDDANNLAHYKLFLDSDEVTYARATIGANTHLHSLVHFTWAFRIGDGNVTNTGKVASWSSNKTIKMQVREYGAANEAILHQIKYWDGDSSALPLSMPVIGITALA